MSNLISISTSDSLSILNTHQSKTMSHFYAHESPILNTYFQDLTNLLITDSHSGSINIWNLEKQSKLPCEAHVLFNVSPLVSTDYNKHSSFHFALDDNGKIYINTIKSYIQEVHEWNYYDNNNNNNKCKPCLIKQDYCNYNQFIIGSCKGVDVFDIRMFKRVGCVLFGNNNKKGNCIINTANDSNEIMIIGNESIELRKWKGINDNNDNDVHGDVVQMWTQFNDEITHCKFEYTLQSKNQDNEIIIGLNNGDVYYSY